MAPPLFIYLFFLFHCLHDKRFNCSFIFCLGPHCTSGWFQFINLRFSSSFYLNLTFAYWLSQSKISPVEEVLFGIVRNYFFHWIDVKKTSSHCIFFDILYQMMQKCYYTRNLPQTLSQPWHFPHTVPLTVLGLLQTPLL